VKSGARSTHHFARDPHEEGNSHLCRLVASDRPRTQRLPFLNVTGTTARSPDEGEDDFNRRVLTAAAKKLDLQRDGESDEA
jgi:hypothetical protein